MLQRRLSPPQPKPIKADTPVEAPKQADATPAPTRPETSAKPKEGEEPASLKVQPTDVPPGTALHRQTVREALRDAMAEEMRADPMVFVMGEEVAEYQGAYKVTQGLLEEFGPAARRRHPDHRIRFRRPRHRRGDGRPEADRRVHDLQLRHAGDRPHHQLGRQDQLYVRRPDALPDGVPRPQRRRLARRGAAQPELRPVVRQRPRPDRHRAVLGRRRQGPAQERDPLARPGGVPRERAALRPQLRRAGGRHRHPDRQGLGGA